jgi:hypothetical protein
MIDVKEREDGSFDISWDLNSPTESILNTWTEQDFIDCIRQECEKILEKDPVTISRLSTEDATDT